MITSVYYNIAGQLIKITSDSDFELIRYLPQLKKFKSDVLIGESVLIDFIEIIIQEEKEIQERYFGDKTEQFEFLNYNCEVSCSKDCNSFKFTAGTNSIKSIILLSEQVKNSRTGNVKIISSAINSTLLNYALWMFFTLALLPKRLIPIHSSVVIYKESALLFLGESGTGKSTQKNLWLRNFDDAICLNDDSPVLDIKRESVGIWGSPWSGKGQVYLNKKYKIRAFIRVVRSLDNKIEKISSALAFGALYPSLPPFLHSFELEEDILCDALSTILEFTPVYNLYCKPENESALITKAELFPDYES